MSEVPFTEEQAKLVFVGQINALADHAAIHGPARDSGSRMAAIIAKHRASIARMKREERAEPEEVSLTPRL